jgi:putative transposase
MQWLQSTLANRLYRAGLIKGGVFERRYKALLIEPGVTLGKVCHYIDLNPVRAGIIPVTRLRNYRFGSYRYLWHRSMRPNSLYFEEALAAAGNLPDTPDGWQAYERYLAWQAERGPAGRNPAYQKLSRGWVIGSKTFRHEQAERHRLAGETGTEGLSTATVEARERKWAAALETALADVASDERADARKSAPWKVAIAVKLKAQTDVTNRWLAEKLSMGSPIYVSKHVGLAQRRVGGSNGRSALSAQGNTWPLEADEDRLPVTLL